MMCGVKQMKWIVVWIFCFTITSIYASDKNISIYDVSKDLTEQNNFIKTLGIMRSIRIVKQKRITKHGRIITECILRLKHNTVAFLQEMISLEGRVTQDGKKPQPITTNYYSKELFKICFAKLLPKQKHELIDYALGETSYDMILFLVKLAPQFLYQDYKLFL